MEKAAGFMQTHKWAVVLAILTSLVTAGPQVYFRMDHAPSGIYQGIELLPDSPWSARVREVQDGHPNFGAIYYKDGKDNPYLFQPLGSIVVASMGRVLGLDINNTILLSRLVLPFFVFLLIYGFTLLVSRSKMVALSAASILVLGEAALEPYGLAMLANGMSPEDFLHIARPVNPAMLYILFFGALAAFWKFFQALDRRWGIVAAVLIGLNFYNYFWGWTYLFAFGGILGLALLIQKRWRDAVGVASVFGGALVVAIPYMLNLHAATEHPHYLLTRMINGVVEMRDPLWVGTMVAAALAAFLIWYPRKNMREYLFGLALMLAPFVTMNQQLLTGLILQVNHYHWFFHKTIAVIFLFIIAFQLLGRFGFGSYRRLLAGLIIAGSFGVGIFVQADSYRRGTNDGGQVAIERQKYGPVMEWLNTNAAKEEVVLANNEASHMVVIYTPLNVFFHRAGMYSLASSPERLRDILFTFYRLRGVGREEAREIFFAERHHLSTNIFGMYYRDSCGSYSCIPDEGVEELLAAYHASLETPTPAWLRNVLGKYEVSYIMWDVEKDPLWQLERYPFLEQTAEFGAIRLYRVK